MKKIMLICLFLIGISAVSRAQGGGRMRMSPADRVKVMKESLKLTDDQVVKITALYEAQGKQMDSLRNAGGDFRTGMRPLMDGTNVKVKAVLTAEQAAAFQKEQDEMRARRQNGGGGGAPPQK